MIRNVPNVYETDAQSTAEDDEDRSAEQGRSTASANASRPTSAHDEDEQRDADVLSEI